MGAGMGYLVGALGGLLLFYGASVVLRAERVRKGEGPWPGRRWAWVLVALGVALIAGMLLLVPSEPSPPPFVR